MKCIKDNCEYDASYTSPDHFCDWHWALWWSEGAHDPKQEDMIEYAKYVCYNSQKRKGINNNQKIILVEDIDFTKFINDDEDGNF